MSDDIDDAINRAKVRRDGRPNKARDQAERARQVQRERKSADDIEYRRCIASALSCAIENNTNVARINVHGSEVGGVSANDLPRIAELARSEGFTVRQRSKTVRQIALRGGSYSEPYLELSGGRLADAVPNPTRESGQGFWSRFWRWLR